jgi:hypothetical protein
MSREPEGLPQWHNGRQIGRWAATLLKKANGVPLTRFAASRTRTAIASEKKRVRLRGTAGPGRATGLCVGGGGSPRSAAEDRGAQASGGQIGRAGVPRVAWA